MPAPDQPEYNPNIIGFTEQDGPIMISLTEAKDRFGKLPSEYQLVSLKSGRDQKKVLNLALGRRVTKKLREDGFTFKPAVFDFFDTWHRDWKQEFGVQMEPFFNLNAPPRIHRMIRRNREILLPTASARLRTDLAAAGLIRKEILNSISDADLPHSVGRILEKKMGKLRNPRKKENLHHFMRLIGIQKTLDRIRSTLSVELAHADLRTVSIFADEIAGALFEISRLVPVPGVETLDIPRGRGIEFQFAPRDISYLLLGKETGDCTADKTPFQADRDIENIYWTVFPWILDRNYQILKVLYDGQFVMKFHLLPMVVCQDNTSRIVMAVDAVETIRAFRDDMPDFCRMDLFDNHADIFDDTLKKITRIAGRMGIENVYAEKFSNTGWVRNYFSRLPEIFLNVNNLIKLDELEDVFCLAKSIDHDNQTLPMQEIFMEVQMKNTSLQPSVSKRNQAIKSFALVQGNAEDGIPMKKIIGI